MPEKIIASMVAVTAALLLGSTVIASAQTGTFPQPGPGYMDNMTPYPGLYGYDPYAGTYWDGVAPYSNAMQPDPYAGTPWEGVAPY